MRKRQVIDLTAERRLVLSYNSLEDEEEIDISRLTKIDFNNIPAELVTTPVLLTEFSVYLAELNERVNLAKMKLEITKAELDIQFRKAHKEETGKDLSN